MEHDSDDTRAQLEQAHRICPYAGTTECYTVRDREPRMIAQGCRRWQCEICGPRKRWQFILRIRTAAPNRFCTLTCRHDETPEAQLATITRALPRLMTSLRKTRGSIDYLRMLETCTDGYPHFHLLIRSDFLPQNEIREHWQRLTKAKIVDIRKAHGRSTGYIAKYLTKARDSQGEWSRQRVSVSRNFWPARTEPTDLIAFEHHRLHPTQHADARPNVTYDRLTPGHYRPRTREPGDENPPELLMPTTMTNV